MCYRISILHVEAKNPDFDILASIKKEIVNVRTGGDENLLINFNWLNGKKTLLLVFITLFGCSFMIYINDEAFVYK